MLEALTEVRDSAQIELVSAELVLLEASAGAAKLRDEVSRLDAAVLALKGETPEVAALFGESPPSEANSEGATTGRRAGVPSDPPPVLTSEEFAAESKRKQRKARKRQKEEELANNPLANVRCSGCGRVGKMFDTVVQAPSGATVRMMVCTGCNNQVMT